MSPWSRTDCRKGADGSAVVVVARDTDVQTVIRRRPRRRSTKSAAASGSSLPIACRVVEALRRPRLVAGNPGPVRFRSHGAVCAHHLVSLAAEQLNVEEAVRRHRRRRFRLCQLPADVPLAARLRNAFVLARRRNARLGQAGRSARHRAARRDDAGHERPRDAARAEGGQAGPAGDHAVGPRAGVDDRRGRAPGRRRLRGQARRSGRARRDRARRRDQERHREDAAGLGDHRAAPAAERRPGPRVPVLGRQPRDEDDRVGHRAGVRQRRHGADSRRERRRQGAGRARDPPALAAQGSAVREGELRGAAGGAARKRAVRPREGRLHRRGDDAHRQVRAGRHRHDLPRRDRRDEGGAAGQAAARAAGRRSSPSSAATSRSTSTCASSRPPTATSKR